MFLELKVCKVGNPCDRLRCVSSLFKIASYDKTVIKLANAEIQFEDLKLQLDDVLGAEDMLMQLTERNLMLARVCRIQAQFDHLTETYFDGFETDLAERELGYVAAFDHDSDMFAASISFTRTSVTARIKEDGTGN